MIPAFPYLSHALGSATRDVEIDVLFREPLDKPSLKRVRTSLGVLGSPRWVGRAASFLVGSRDLRRGLAADPTYADAPPEDAQMRARYGVTGTQSDTQRRMLAYSTLVDDRLVALHDDVPIAFVTARHGERTARTSWHEASTARLEEVFDALAAHYASPDVRALAHRSYTRRNYYTSPGHLMVAALRGAFVTPASARRRPAEERRRAADVAATAVGFAALTDRQLFGLRTVLAGIPQDEQLALLPESLRATYTKKDRGDPVDAAF